jgi:hypothetical protein
METQTEQEQTIVFNYTQKQNALKNLQTEQAFKDLGIEVYK